MLCSVCAAESSAAEKVLESAEEKAAGIATASKATTWKGKQARSVRNTLSAVKIQPTLKKFGAAQEQQDAEKASAKQHRLVTDGLSVLDKQAVGRTNQILKQDEKAVQTTEKMLSEAKQELGDNKKRESLLGKLKATAANKVFEKKRVVADEKRKVNTDKKAAAKQTDAAQSARDNVIKRFSFISKFFKPAVKGSTGKGSTAVKDAKDAKALRSKFYQSIAKRETAAATDATLVSDTLSLAKDERTLAKDKKLSEKLSEKFQGLLSDKKNVKNSLEKYKKSVASELNKAVKDKAEKTTQSKKELNDDSTSKELHAVESVAKNAAEKFKSIDDEADAADAVKKADKVLPVNKMLPAGRPSMRHVSVSKVLTAARKKWEAAKVAASKKDHASKNKVSDAKYEKKKAEAQKKLEVKDSVREIAANTAANVKDAAAAAAKKAAAKLSWGKRRLSIPTSVVTQAKATGDAAEKMAKSAQAHAAEMKKDTKSATSWFMKAIGDHAAAARAASAAKVKALTSKETADALKDELAVLKKREIDDEKALGQQKMLKEQGTASSVASISVAKNSKVAEAAKNALKQRETLQKKAALRESADGVAAKQAAAEVATERKKLQHDRAVEIEAAKHKEATEKGVGRVKVAMKEKKKAVKEEEEVGRATIAKGEAAAAAKSGKKAVEKLNLVVAECSPPFHSFM